MCVLLNCTRIMNNNNYFYLVRQITGSLFKKIDQYIFAKVFKHIYIIYAAFMIIKNYNQEHSDLMHNNR